MFERYTERARRVIFFARYEASQFGSTTIETEHLLLGLLREDKNLTNRFLRNSSSIESIRMEVEARTTVREKVSTSIDLPLTDECKRILAYAAEEAERLNHRHIGTEHLLLGILREEKCTAAEILHERGLRLDAIREEISGSLINRPGEMLTPPGGARAANMMVPDQSTAKLIAEAIWRPVYGAETIRKQSSVEAVVMKLMIWRVIAGPLFAFIRMMDGKVLSMGQTAEETPQFERYTAAARRVLFFARDEASQSGSTTIETEHLLLALVREDKVLLRPFIPDDITVSIREKLGRQVEIRPKPPATVNLPLSDECKRILDHTAEEAARLNQTHVGTEHLLLGILSEESCTAAKVLAGLGLELKAMREDVLRRPPSPGVNLADSARQFATVDETMIPAAGVVPDLETAKRIAEAVWISYVSIDTGDRVEADVANLTLGVWIVTGSLTSDEVETKLAAFIQKDDGKIIRLHHDEAPT